MKNKHLYYIIFFSIFMIFSLFLGCAKNNKSNDDVDTTAPSIEDQIFTISDNLLVGEFVGQIEANDNNGVTNFNIQDGNTNNVFTFAIDNEGKLTITNISSEFAINNNYTLTIEVSDSAGNRAMANVIINLTNAPPVIENQDFFISDTSRNGESVVQVEVHDIRGILTYIFEDGNSGETFVINNRGEITVDNASSFVNTQLYILTIEVSDEVNNKATAKITIRVGDPPPIIPSGQKFQIRELSTADTVVDKLGTNDDRLLANDDRGIMGYQINAGDSENAFAIDNTGIIKLTGNVEIDFETTPEYVLTVEVSDTKRQTTITEITIAIIDVILVNIDNVPDNASLKLDGISSVTTAMVGSTNYLFASGFFDDGVSVFSVGNNGTLTSVDNVNDSDNLKLDGARSVTTSVVGSTTYLFVVGGEDDGVSVFSVGNDGILIPVHNEPDSGDLELDGVISVTTSVVGSTTYLFVAGFVDDGVSVFSVGNDGTLTSVDNVNDNDNLELDGTRSVTTAVVGSTNYLFVAGFVDDGVSIFSVGNNGKLASVHNEPDSGDLELDEAISLTTSVVGGTNYLFVAGFMDDGVSVFSVGNDGTLTSVDNVTDSGNLEINGAISVTTATVSSTTYLFVAGQTDDGVSVFSVRNDGTLISVDNVTDNDNLELDGAISLTTSVVGSTTYLFVAGQTDDGVSVFRIDK